MNLTLKQNYFSNTKEVVFQEDVLTYTSGLTMIYGEPKSGKSTLALWQLRQLKKKGFINNFIYIDIDSKTKGQQKAIFNISKKEEWVYLTPAMVEETFKNKYLFTMAVINNYKDKYQAFLVDTWASLTEHIKENDASSIKPISNSIRDLVVEKDLLITLIGHTGKDRTKKVRGSSEIRGSLSYSLEVMRDAETNKSIITVADDSESDNSGKRFELIIERTNSLADAKVKLIELKKEALLTNKQIEDLKIAKQKKFLALYIASYLSKMKNESVPTQTLRTFILRNINKLENGKNKLPDHEKYVPVKLIKETYADMLETMFTVTSVMPSSGKGRPTKHILKVDKNEFLNSIEGNESLPELYQASILKGKQ
jgi:hypothetical protein